jgi:hypothetical protein
LRDFRNEEFKGFDYHQTNHNSENTIEEEKRLSQEEED